MFIDWNGYLIFEASRLKGILWSRRLLNLRMVAVRLRGGIRGEY